LVECHTKMKLKKTHTTLETRKYRFSKEFCVSHTTRPKVGPFNSDFDFQYYTWNYYWFRAVTTLCHSMEFTASVCRKAHCFWLTTGIHSQNAGMSFVNCCWRHNERRTLSTLAQNKFYDFVLEKIWSCNSLIPT